MQTTQALIRLLLWASWSVPFNFTCPISMLRKKAISSELSLQLYYRFEVDESSPDDPVYEEGYCYWILSKTIKPQKSKTKTAVKETENKENVTNTTNVNGAAAMATS